MLLPGTTTTTSILPAFFTSFQLLPFIYGEVSFSELQIGGKPKNTRQKDILLTQKRKKWFVAYSQHMGGECLTFDQKAIRLG
ncbi:hypothetical protein L2E82_26915 [Cichorium intybus]|uniref:Uncharacterized protein n=1 Tax=Cichorium intybus TaxID=13427 RepID=A0ACB9CRS6_CICIN|nr:hypothetical protein L2E82_26915 [Cichorium intybus]